ncbi:unnamed protein product [Protopolystoma xenopodis]|uniref:Enkurin domain-containing protein n=1 Tax=Protopolystoma xenopodis TaxID=117903 RepID=A0A3S5FFK4_9PLAT|nr:unnamed protein product [Protopolystoma xenopodis]
MKANNMMQQLNEADKKELLTGLKLRWQELYHQFQLLSVMIDTVPKKHKKERLENEMQILENDIDTLERHKIIYIAK